MSDLFLLLGPSAAQGKTGEKGVTEMGQQGALQSNDQHKGDITTWHFIYLDTFYIEERDYVPEIYNIENLTKRKKEKTVSTS